MSDQKIKQSAKKPPLGIIPRQALIGIARVFSYGAKKYAPGNWRRATVSDGAPLRYISAMERHLAAIQHPNGTYEPQSLSALDEESGLPHIDHAICSLLMLRGILIKDGVLAADPGEGSEPPSEKQIADAVWYL